ncbi:hypothetical protein KSS87_008840 [Heliosperma pusillum]|nr:hypothetical protein KSS87_008840 [Heliosperma pusillum]
MADTFDPDLIHAIFKLVWRRKADERERNEGIDTADLEGGAGTLKKVRPTSGTHLLTWFTNILMLQNAENSCPYRFS